MTAAIIAGLSISCVHTKSGCPAEYAEDQNGLFRKHVPHAVAVHAGDIPFRQTFNLKLGDSLLFTLPSGKTVALWPQRNTPHDERETKSGLWCRWGVQPFVMPPFTETTNSSGRIEHWTSYIRVGADRTTCDVETVSEMNVDDLQFNYVTDLNSRRSLKVTVIIEPTIQNKDGTQPGVGR